MSNPIYILGDSHIRAFSFANQIMPIFIGPAAFNNFLSERNALMVINKIDHLICSLESDLKELILIISGDVIHVSRKSEGKEKDLIKLDAAIKRYSEFIDKFHVSYPNVKLVVGAVFPGCTDMYLQYELYYNERLQNICHNVAVPFINVNTVITTDGKLDFPFKADFAHVNYRVVKPFLELLSENINANLEDRCYYNDFRWEYVYNIETKVGPLKIWGDIYRDQLILEEEQILLLSEFQKRSLEYVSALTGIMDFVGDKLTLSSYTVGNCKEGFLVFEIKKILDVDVNGFDLNLTRIERAEQLKKLYNLNSVQFCEYTSDNFEFNKVIIDFEIYRLNSDLKQILFNKYFENGDCCFIRSVSFKSDKRMLEKAGFKVVIHFEKLLESVIIIAARERYRTEIEKTNQISNPALVNKIKNRIARLIKEPQ
jgi:hypothetical protein